MDEFRAKDIQELFRLERRFSFQRFAELLFTQSGVLLVSLPGALVYVAGGVFFLGRLGFTDKAVPPVIKKESSILG